MAAFTPLSADELTDFLGAHDIPKPAEFRVVEAGSVNSNFSVRVGAARYFLRLYEEQDAEGAVRERAMLAALADAGVPTPIALAHGTLAGKPAALFPWVGGVHVCQRSVTAAHAHAVGASLARVHRANVAAVEGRFDEDALAARLDRIDAKTYPRDRLRATLTALTRERARDLPMGLVHGDLFRDNVLFEGDRIAALLDFESASRGAFAYDLAVTLLAWSFGSALETALMRAMVAGYESVRPLDAHEKDAFYTEMRMAALRFTITRITDYAMRGEAAGPRVMKDWRRFLARLDAVEVLGAAPWRALLFN